MNFLYSLIFSYLIWKFWRLWY